MALIKPEYSYRIYNFLFIGLAFTIPLSNRVSSGAIALIGLLWLLEFNFIEKIRNIRRSPVNKHVLLFALIYIPYLLGTIYSENLTDKGGALFVLEHKLSLLLFPIFIATIDFSRFRPEFRKNIFKAFIIGCGINSVFLLNLAISVYFKEGSTKAFFYSSLSGPYHPAYLTLYYTFAVIVLLQWLFENGRTASGKRTQAIIGILYLQIFVIFFSSKAGIIGLMAVYVFAMVYLFLFYRKGIRIALITTSFLLAVFLVIFVSTPPVFNRFFAAKKSVENNLNNTVEKTDGTVARIKIWQSAVQIIKSNPILGVGTGDTQCELYKKYEENGIDVAMEKELNAHNQFLQVYLSTGLLGFLVLIITLLIPFYLALKKRQLIYLLFILVMILHLLVESMFARQAGVVFYAFFNAFLFYYSFHQTQNPES